MLRVDENGAVSSQVLQSHEVVESGWVIVLSTRFRFLSLEYTKRTLHALREFRIDWHSLNVRDAQIRSPE